jgi:hypothetical protein
MQAFDTERMTFEGREFLVSRYYDDTNEAPWDRADGHGPVRWISDREPLAKGETVLHDDRHGRWVYDIAGAIQQSIREGWGRPSKETRERLALQLRKPARKVSAIDADMSFLRGWCADDWCYIGIGVQLIGPDGEPPREEFEHALWGVESCGDYWQEVAGELAREILAERATVWRGALKEARARRYWASRDVMTLGA